MSEIFDALRLLELQQREQQAGTNQTQAQSAPFPISASELSAIGEQLIHAVEMAEQGRQGGAGAEAQ